MGHVHVHALLGHATAPVCTVSWYDTRYIKVRMLVCAGKGGAGLFNFVRRLQGLGNRSWEAHVGGYDASPTTATNSSQDSEERVTLPATSQLTNMGQGKGNRIPSISCCDAPGDARRQGWLPFVVAPRVLSMLHACRCMFANMQVRLAAVLQLGRARPSADCMRPGDTRPARLSHPSAPHATEATSARGETVPYSRALAVSRLHLDQNTNQDHVSLLRPLGDLKSAIALQRQLTASSTRTCCGTWAGKCPNSMRINSIRINI